MARHVNIPSPFTDWRILALISLIVSTLLSDATWGGSDARIFIQHQDTGVVLTNLDSGTPEFSHSNETDDDRRSTGFSQTLLEYIRDQVPKDNNWDISLYKIIAEPLVDYMSTSAETPPEKSILYSSTSLAFWASIAKSLFLAYNFKGGSFTSTSFRLPEVSQQKDSENDYLTRYENTTYINEDALILTIGLYDKKYVGPGSLPLVLIDVSYIRNTPETATLSLIDISNPTSTLSLGEKILRLDRSFSSLIKNSPRYLSTRIQDTSSASTVIIAQDPPFNSAIRGGLAGAGAGAVLGSGLELGLNYLSPLPVPQPFGAISIPSLALMSAWTAHQTLKQRGTAPQCIALEYVDNWLRRAEKQPPRPIGLKGAFENAKNLFSNDKDISACAGLRYRKSAVSPLQKVSGFKVNPNPLPGFLKYKRS